MIMLTSNLASEVVKDAVGLKLEIAETQL
jgi:hypothetical protein